MNAGKVRPRPLWLRLSVLEGSACFNVRRGANIFRCVNGHNICAVCKAANSDDPSDALVLCPMCGVSYGDNVVRNVPVETLMRASGNMVFDGCVNDGCHFKSISLAVLKEHERHHCGHRMVTCTKEGDCGEMMKATELGQHLKYGCCKSTVTAEHDVINRGHRAALSPFKAVMFEDLGEDGDRKKCKNAEEGCKVTGGGNSVAEHEKKCEWRKVPCPYSFCNQYINFVARSPKASAL